MKPKLAIYLRVSTLGQKEDDTIQRQIMTFELQWAALSKSFDLYERVPGGKQEDQYFKDEGYNLEEWKVDTDFHKLMTAIQTEQIDAIYVDEENRLFRARSREFRGRVLDLIEQNEVRIVTKNGEVSAGSLAMEIVSAVGADDKRAMLRKCHEAKITRLRDEGRPPTGMSPFGLLWNKKEKRWDLVTEEARVIRCAVGLSIGKIYDEMPKELKGLIELNPGGLPDKEVAQALTRVGFSKRKTKRSVSSGIDYGGIKALFASDTYRGKISFRLKRADQVGNPKFKNGNEHKLLFEVAVPRILTDEDWDSLCFKRSSRRKWAKRNVRHNYLCKDILICSECGIPLAARPKDTERFLKREKRTVCYPSTLYYTCARKQKTNGVRCSSRKCHGVKVIDELVWQKVMGLLESPERILSLYSKYKDDSQDLLRTERIKSSKECLGTELNRLKAISLKLTMGLGAGKLTLEEYDVANTENKLAQLKANQEIHELDEVLNSQENESTDLYELACQISSRLTTTSFEERREILIAVASSISISNEGEIAINFKGGLSLNI